MKFIDLSLIDVIERRTYDFRMMDILHHAYVYMDKGKNRVAVTADALNSMIMLAL